MSRPLVYLDTCGIQRPFDAKTHARIIVEAEAILGILDLLEDDQIQLASSEVLLYEIRRNPHPLRKKHGLRVLEFATIYVEARKDVVERARHLESVGLAALDALHLASAEAADVDFFCTCDDKLVKRAERENLDFEVVYPTVLLGRVE